MDAVLSVLDFAMGDAAFLRVLIVEDEALVAMLLEDMILDAGHQVVRVLSDIGTAVDYVAAEAASFDIAILDVNLAGQPSYPVAEGLAAKGKPFVFSTGYGRDGLPPIWRDRPVLAKPFGADAVVQAVQDAAKT